MNRLSARSLKFNAILLRDPAYQYFRVARHARRTRQWVDFWSVENGQSLLWEKARCETLFSRRWDTHFVIDQIWNTLSAWKITPDICSKPLWESVEWPANNSDTRWVFLELTPTFEKIYLYRFCRKIFFEKNHVLPPT